MSSFLEIIEVFCLALVCGIGSSAPIGPINLWVTEATLQNNTRRIPPFLAGVLLSDLTYAFLATRGFTALHSHLPSLQKWIVLLGGTFLIGLGGIGLFTVLQNRPPVVSSGSSRHSLSFLTGIVLCGSNPAFFLFWVMITAVLTDTLLLHFSLPITLTFLVGIALGDLIWFKTLIRIVQVGRRKLGWNLLKLIRISVSTLFILLGVLAIGRIYLST